MKGKTPGVKRRKRADGLAYYWLVPKKDIAAGYRQKIVPLPRCLTEEEAAAEARGLWGELETWRREKTERPTQYTFACLIDRYKGDEFSPYNTKLSFASKRNYDQDMKIIRADIGKVPIYDRARKPLTGEDAWRWHRRWGKPDDTGKPTAPSRARHVITMVRMLVKYAVVIGVPGAADFATVLEKMEFPTTAPRTVAPTRNQVLAIVAECLKRGLRSMGIATLAQFEFTERRISVIGRWEGKGAAQQWRPGWLWTGISDDWIIHYQQRKRGVNEREFDLKDTPMLLAMLQESPKDKRIGPVIVCARTGLPWREKHYTDTFREVARAAGVPDNVWSMDMRAGGATEADELQVSDRQLQDALGHKDPKTKDRYRRSKQRNAQNVVRLRQSAKGERS
jgi:hypothetical protein